MQKEKAYMFNKVETDLNFIERENKVKSFWKENQIFEKSIEASHFFKVK